MNLLTKIDFKYDFELQRNLKFRTSVYMEHLRFHFISRNIRLCSRPIKKLLGYLPEKIRIRLSTENFCQECYPIYIKINHAPKDFNLRYSFINKKRPRGRFYHETDEVLFYKLCGMEDGLYTLYFSIEAI